MKVLNIEILLDYSKKHPETGQVLASWLVIARAATWKTPLEIKQRYPRASILGNNRVVFDIKGGSHRLISVINYPFSILEIRFIGTHVEYDKVNAEKI